MIIRYTDHAANERTFLAWIRTALAIMAFGCFLAKFDLFLRFIVPQSLAGIPQHTLTESATLQAFVLIGAGIALLPLSLWRYRRIRRAIIAAQTQDSNVDHVELLLILILSVVGVGILIMLVAMKGTI
ncbi:hypothetical protein BGC31_02945 [Komagataeibacter xylinus]|nr:hypothetical protein H845_1064 [Komagataeibacter xylinus E25]RFP00639.1 hypothetical protein BFX83_02295 [Komagataeibacter xylinus]RFP05905.1 hypothetical protein BGC31_02945 [Komagataeibacter xylinus]